MKASLKDINNAQGTLAAVVAIFYTASEYSPKDELRMNDTT